MKVLLKKNVKYKDEPHAIGEEIEIDEDDLEAFQNADVIDKLIEEEGEDVKAKVRIKRETEEIEEIREVEKSEPLEEDLSTIEEEINTNAYEDMTKTEISEILTQRGIDHSTKGLKEDLVALLVGSDK